MNQEREHGRAAILLLGVVLACGVLAWLVFREGGAGTGSGPDLRSKDEAAGALEPLEAVGTGAPPALRVEKSAVGTVRLPAERGTAEPVAVAKSPHGERLLQAIGRLEELVSSEEAEEEKGDEAEEDWEREWESLTGRLMARVSANPDLARLMRDRMDETADEALAIRLARILRASSDEPFLQEMAKRVTESPEAMQRRTAMLVLETKDARLWYDGVTTAYRNDDIPAVRDEASYVLGRSLADRKHIRVHRKLRAEIQSELQSADPAARERALRTMMADRTAGPEDLQLAKSFLEDEDAAVRQAATSTVRVLEPRVQRLLDRRAD